MLLLKTLTPLAYSAAATVSFSYALRGFPSR